MKSLRVLHVIPSVGPLRGGPSEFVTLLCKTLAEMGVDVTIATTDDNGPRRLDVQTGRFFERDGYDVIYFPRQTKNYTVSVPLARWLRGNVSRYDCFHIHAVFSFAPTVAAFLARKNSIPYFLHPHGILEDWGMREGRKLAKRLSIALNEKKMLRGAECVFFTSGKEKEESIGKIKDVNYQIVPVGLGLEAYKPGKTRRWLKERYPETSGKKVILFLSRIHKKKGLELLINALAKANLEDTLLVVAGEGEEGYVKKMRAMADSLKVRAVWVGHLGNEEKRAILAESDLFVLPSWSESFGLSVVEAMASGTPVLISDRVGISEEVKSAGAGLVVPCSVSALAEALVYLMEDDDLRCRMGDSGRMLARERYDIHAVAEKIFECYRAAVR